MSHRAPAPTCGEIPLPAAYSLEPAAQVALEDYARVMTRAQSAEVVLSDSSVAGVHLCGLPGPATVAAERDVADFARELAASERGGGLGWS